LELRVKIKFEDFLNKFWIKEAGYNLALCSQHTNAHIKNIIHNMYSNTDIQFILNLYVVGMHCTSYMTKVDRAITL
jgi:hypothetical protein